MESGLEDRNNEIYTAEGNIKVIVSMESGLEDRNNVEDYTTLRLAKDKSQWSPA